MLKCCNSTILSVECTTTQVILGRTLFKRIFMRVLSYAFLSVVVSPPPSSPLYLQALMPSPEDAQDSVAADDSQKTLDQESPLVEGKLAMEQVGNSPAEPMDLGEGSTPAETYENPFLKPPKRIKLKIL